MKNLYLIITVVLILAFLLVPLMAVEDKESTEVSSFQSSAIPPKKSESFRVMQRKSGKVLKLSAEEYLMGVLAEEMSAEYNLEALKAQAVAAYTFAIRKKALSGNNSYDITDDYTIDQGYLDKAARSKKWGDKAEEYEKKLGEAVTAVKDEVILYKNEPILAAYHSVSSGNTESAKNVWGTDYPYLQSVTSAADLLAPDFLSEASFKCEDAEKILKELGCKIPEKGEITVGKSQKSEAGTVLKITLCGKELKGSDVRAAFSLRSSAFEVIFKENKLIFTVSGYGHLVGMSQFGANYMAEQGSGYKEILKNYYKGVEIKKMS